MYSSALIGKSHAKIKGVTFLNPGIAVASLAFIFGHSTISGFQTVSHTWASRMDLSPVTTYPIDPVVILGAGVYFGEKYPTSVATIFVHVLRK